MLAARGTPFRSGLHHPPSRQLSRVQSFEHPRCREAPQPATPVGPRWNSPPTEPQDRQPPAARRATPATTAHHPPDTLVTIQPADGRRQPRRQNPASHLLTYRLQPPPDSPQRRRTPARAPPREVARRTRTQETPAQRDGGGWAPSRIPWARPRPGRGAHAAPPATGSATQEAHGAGRRAAVPGKPLRPAKGSRISDRRPC